MLKLSRFSAFSSALGFFIFVFTSQGRDLLDGLGSSDQNPRFFAHQLFLLVGSLAWASATWYTARALLYRQYPDTPAVTERIEFRRIWTPRLLGAGNLLAIGLGAALEGQLAFGIFYCALAGAFPVVLAFRRKLFRRCFAGQEGYFLPSRPLRGTGFALVATVAVSYVLLALFVAFKVVLPQWLGAGAIFSAAAASWVAFGNLVIFYLTPLYRASALAAGLIVYVAAISGLNDNHDIRTVAQGHGVGFDRPTLDAHLVQWLGAKGRPASPSSPFPVYIVATEGGGIRAAYWTASVLARLQELDPNFAGHLFAISGVSGGSLGALVFDGLLVEAHQATVSPGTASAPPLLRTAQSILAEDFLSPTVAAMLFPDGLQRFVPFPLSSWDRAKALEAAWEVGWARHARSDRFGGPFLDLWAGDRRYAIPSLLLNGTWVESGRRVITSNLYIDAGTFADAIDFLAESNTDVPVSTAAHNSARFTYVSPAGRLRRAGVSGHWGHLVDGGYFENSGTLTASEVLAAVLQRARTHHLLPIVLYISNAPGALDMAAPGPSDLLSEFLAPWETLWKTRDARGSLSRRTLADMSNDAGRDWKIEVAYFEVGLPRRKTSPPLGWFLSPSAREAMNERLRAEEVRLCAALKPIGPSPHCPN